MHHNFFAYGSFSVGQAHFHIISQLIVSQTPGLARGEFYRMRCGYPAMLADEGAPPAEGTLYELEAPGSFWPIFDELLGVDASKPERGFFIRQNVKVSLGNFTQKEAWSYCLNPKKLHQVKGKILQGDWKKDLRSHPPITEKLLPRQRDYILKLHSSKSRDIVPIKLDLYRELLNLELIVDKGRRLALTPLGKETALFINPNSLH